jgi:fidgetin-like protein 1
MTSKWIGDSEKIVRALFAVAKSKQPSIIFIDEIDSLLSARSESENDNLRGLKTEFLVQLDGMNSRSTDKILVIAATNRPHTLDEAARRRFTRRIYIGLPNDVARKQIVKLLLKNDEHSLNEEDFDSIASATEMFSCSDVKELVRTAACVGIRDIGDRIHDPKFKPPPISMKDFDVAKTEVSTSVCESDVDFHLNWNGVYGSFKKIITKDAELPEE